MNMVTMTELADLAIGNPEAGSVNFTALYTLLQGVLDHLGIGSLKRNHEREASVRPKGGFLAGLEESTCSPDSDGLSAHALAQRLARLEQRLDDLDQLPSTDALLRQSSPSSTQQVRDMWQLLQLRKKAEANQDGITKAMSVIGDMLDEVRSLKDTRDSTLTQMEALQVNLQEVKDVVKALEDIKEQMKHMEESMRSLTSDMAAIPHPEELVLWSHVVEALPQLGSPPGQPSTESIQQLGQQALQGMGGLSAEQVTLREELGSLQDQLCQHMLSVANKNIPDNIQTHLKSLDDELQVLKTKDMQEQHDMTSLREKLAEFSAESVRQNAATQQLLDHYREMENRVSVLEQQRDTHSRKGSVKSGEEECESGVREKASCLSEAQQRAISQHLSSILQDLLPTLSTQDRDWQSMLDKLSRDMERKLDRVELTPLKQELEEGWRRVKARLQEEQELSTETPAGFRKKLLEKVACISCDKPANILTGMHMVTVQSRPPRPDGSFPVGSQQHSWAWGFPRAVGGGVPIRRAVARRPSSAQILHTLYPGIDPALQPYCREEVGILGTDGIMYRGRVELNLPSLVTPGARPSTPVLAQRV